MWVEGFTFGGVASQQFTINLSALSGAPAVQTAGFETIQDEQLQDAGGEGAVLVRIRGQLAFHLPTGLTACTVRVAVVQRQRDAAGNFLEYDLFSQRDLGSEDVMWMRQVYVTPLDSLSDNNVATDFTGVWGEVVNHSHRYLGVDIKARRRLDDLTRPILLVQTLGNGANGATTLLGSGYLRFLLRKR